VCQKQKAIAKQSQVESSFHTYLGLHGQNYEKQQQLLAIGISFFWICSIMWI